MFIKEAFCPQNNMVVHIDASRAVVAEPTGVNVYARELLEHLPIMAPEIKFVFYAPQWEKNAVERNFPNLPVNCEWRFLAWPPKFLWTQICLARAWARAATADATAVFFAPAHVAPFFAPRNLVITVHDVAHRVVPAAYSWRERFFADVLVRRNTKKARAILAISADTKNNLEKFFAVAAEKIVVTPLALPCARSGVVGSLPESLRAKKFILFVGRMEWKKGVDRLLRAFFAVRHLVPGVELVLAGKPGVGYEQIKNLFTYADTNFVHELGFVDDAILNALYQNASVFVLPSRYEGFGLNPLEAMRANVPVVAWRAGAISEVVGDAGVLVSTEEELITALTRILTEANFATELRNRGQQQLKNFSWEKTCGGTLKVLLA